MFPNENTVIQARYCELTKQHRLMNSVSVCTDVGCSLEQDVLMTDASAHKTTSSSRGLPPTVEPLPSKDKTKEAISRFFSFCVKNSAEENIAALIRAGGLVADGGAHPAVRPAVPGTAGAG